VVLVASNPCFVQRPHWQHGMPAHVFNTFATDLAGDYGAALDRFLALEVHGSDHARQALRELRDCAFSHGAPMSRALDGGLALLHQVDFSMELANLNMPLLAIGGRRDRLVPPAALSEAAARAGHGEVAIIAGAGHAPFIGHRDEFVQRVVEFAT